MFNLILFFVENVKDEPKSSEAATTTKYSKKKVPGRPRAKAVATSKLEEQLKAVADETPVVDNFGAAEKVEEPHDVEVVDANNIDSEKEAEKGVGCVGQSEEKEQKSTEVDEPVVEKVCELAEKGNNVVEVEVSASQDSSISFKQPERTLVDLNISVDDEDSMGPKEGEKGGEELKEEEELREQGGEKGKDELKEQKAEEGEKELKEQEAENRMEELKEQGGDKGEEALNELEEEKGKEEFKDQDGEKPKDELKEEETNIIGRKHSNTESFSAVLKDQLQKDVNPRIDGDEGTKSSEKLDLGEHGGEVLIEEDPEEPPEETEAQEEEHMELEAITKQRKINKEHEIFVGGLDRDATEEDLRKVFQRIGEVVEVRLHKNSSTNKNKGYAFVKFASKEQAKKALSEMKNPVVCFSSSD